MLYHHLVIVNQLQLHGLFSKSVRTLVNYNSQLAYIKIYQARTVMVPPNCPEQNLVVTGHGSEGFAIITFDKRRYQCGIVLPCWLYQAQVSSGYLSVHALVF